MTRNQKPVVTPVEIVRILRAHPLHWIVPTVVFAAAAVAYAFLHAASWDASQALMVRDEASGAAARQGKFQQPDEMKTVQETILELARSRAVLSAALAEVGPDAKDVVNGVWPTDAAIAGLQGHVKLNPPKGAEFGKTEVFYLNVEAPSAARATALTAAVTKQLQLRSQDLRSQKAQSLIAELSKTAELAKAELTKSTDALTQVESRVGSDLGELRVLNEVGGGDSPLRRSINEMDQEIRQARQAIDANRELLSLLENSKNDPQSLVAAPNRLLEAQPVLRRLKDGLVDAQLRTAQLAGNMTDTHPAVIAAKDSEDKIRQQVRGEIDSSVVGIQAELKLSNERLATLEKQMSEARSRLGNLADMRAEYANILADRNQRADIVKTAEQQLADAKASRAAAGAASLIAVVDSPVAGDAPVGPSKAMIVLAGLVGGFVTGLGIVFLSVQPAQSTALTLNQNNQAEFGSEADEAFGLLSNDTRLITTHVFNGFAISNRRLNSFTPWQNRTTHGQMQSAGGLSLNQALVKMALAR